MTKSGSHRSMLSKIKLRLRQRLAGPIPFKNSAEYWENRYREGGNSGAGSYNRLAEFKAEVVNDFVKRNNVRSVVELGVGDGAQLRLADYPLYTGFDVSKSVVAKTRALFAQDSSVRILHISELTDRTKADLSLSLDVIYHLVEDNVFDLYMEQLFDISTKFVIIYASNSDSEWPDPHVRHRKFTRWVEQRRPDYKLIDTIKNRYPHSDIDPDNTSFSDFYIFAKSI